MQVNTQLRPEQAMALDAYAETGDAPLTRPQAVRAILIDWLTGHGFLKRTVDHPKPVGPATDAIKRMDGDIAKDKAKRKR